MKTITTIPDYCREVNIPQSKHAIFDIRRFEDKVKTENQKQEAFRHEFYAIALRHSGYNKSVNGAQLQANLFFNSPYQVISWDVLPDWKGWYIMFGQDFLALNPAWKNFIADYPFFRLDKSTPLDLPPQDATLADGLFQNIYQEYQSEKVDKFAFIQAYTSLLLLVTKRYFSGLYLATTTGYSNRRADVLLLSRFQALIETNLANEATDEPIKSPSFYASKLNVHSNHLNAVVKRITGKTATTLIQDQLVTVAKSLLGQASLSVKEVAYRLQFNNPTHFTSFFKQATGFTPHQYQKKQIL